MLRQQGAKLLNRIGVAIDDHRAGPAGTPLQVAVLPYRMGSQGIEILLITSRRSRRWILPKGWPQHGQSLAQSAAREAYEEAGVKGSAQEDELGRFTTQKLASGPHPVAVFAMMIDTELPHWPEQRERLRKWFAKAEAVNLVSPEQREIVRGFNPAPRPA